MPFHWGRLAGRFDAANNVTLSEVDPISLEPELKACAVEVRLRPGYEAIRATKLFRRLAKVVKR